jgi:hypothetical protein
MKCKTLPLSPTNYRRCGQRMCSNCGPYSGRLVQEQTLLDLEEGLAALLSLNISDRAPSIDSSPSTLLHKDETHC